MTHVTCMLTAQNRDQLRNPTLGKRVWATFSFFTGAQFCRLCGGYAIQTTATGQNSDALSQHLRRQSAYRAARIIPGEFV